MITATIDNKKVQVPDSITILEAARSVGIEIPTLCHHPLLEPSGGCRLCVVEIENMPRLQTSCSLPITNGMVIWTNSEKVIGARRSVLEFLLINHAIECPFCDKAGECELQELVSKYGATQSRFKEKKKDPIINNDDPYILRNMRLCILCERCVRVCREVQGASAISVTGRGHRSVVEPFSGGVFECEYCGNCVVVCPVGALTAKYHKHVYRPWYVEKALSTICPQCGVGCNITAQSRGNSLIRVWPIMGKGPNKGIICKRGFFDILTNTQGALNTPMIRVDGNLKGCDYKEAIALISDGLKAVRNKKGPTAIAGIISPFCTNEEAYLFQKLLRTVLGTNNIDSMAGTFFAPALLNFERLLGKGATTNRLSDIAKADGVFVMGADPMAESPVLGVHIRIANQKGRAPIIVIGEARGLSRQITYKVRPIAGTEESLLSALVFEIIKVKPLSGQNPMLEEAILAHEETSVERAAEICKIAKKDIIRLIDELLPLNNPVLVLGKDFINHANEANTLLMVAALSYTLNAKIHLVSPYPNERGLFDMGCFHSVLPGGKTITFEAYRRQYGSLTGGAIPTVAGKPLMEILRGCISGHINALYIYGEGALNGFPDKALLRDALSRVDFVALHDSHSSIVSEYAHVVTPSNSWLYKGGTFTNIEGIVQSIEKALDSPLMPDWKLLCDLAAALGQRWNYQHLPSVYSEITKVVPAYA